MIQPAILKYYKYLLYCIDNNKNRETCRDFGLIELLLLSVDWSWWIVIEETTLSSSIENLMYGCVHYDILRERSRIYFMNA